MKRVGVLLLFVLLVCQVSVVYAQYPRHVDPAQYELAEPDPEVLFMLYHNLYMGMIMENMTIQEEWLRWVMDVYSVEDLTLMFKEYGEELRLESSNLNLTRFYFDKSMLYFDEAMHNIGELDLQTAWDNFLQGLMYLEQSNDTIPVLRDSTTRLGARLEADPVILLDDIDELQALIDEYAEFAQLTMDLIEGGKMSGEDLGKIKDVLQGVVEEELLNELLGYIDDLGGGVDLLSVTQTQLTVYTNVSSVWVGAGVGVSGRLTAGGVGLPGRVISVTLGEDAYTAVSDGDGVFALDLRVPHVYEDSVVVRASYWPRGEDAKVYMPATVSGTLFLLFIVPELDLSHSGFALPGCLWTLSGVLTHDGAGLPGFEIKLRIFGEDYGAVTDEGGGFGFDVNVPVDVPLGSAFVLVSSEPSGVYSGVLKRFSVNVVQLPLVLEVDSPGWVLSGFIGRLRVSLTAGGLPVDLCEIRLVGEDDGGVDYSVDGVGCVDVAVPLLRFSGDYAWRLVADPAEPWIGGASLSGGFYVVNTMSVLFSVACVGVLAYILGRRLRDIEVKVGGLVEPVVEPLSVPVAEPVPVSSFSGLFLVALRIVERLSGVVMAPSDTLREHLARVLGRVSGRFGELFSELVARYELWLYGGSHEVELGEVEVLVAELEGDRDEG